MCLRVLKESNKSKFDSFSRYEQCIDHIPYYISGLPRAHFFRQPFSKQLYSIPSLRFVTHCRLRRKKSDAELGSAVSCSDYPLPGG